MIRNQQSTAGILVIVLMGATLLGCESDPTTFSEWKRISAKDSMVVFLPSAEEKIPLIVRRERHQANVQQEHWTWRGGELLLGDLSPGMYYQQSFKTPDELKSQAQDWRRLKRMGLTVRDKEIKYGEGGLGRFVYSLSNSSDGAQSCFVFMQALRDADGGDSPGTGSVTSGGYATGYQCTGNDETAKAKLANTMLRHLKALELRE